MLTLLLALYQLIFVSPLEHKIDAFLAERHFQGAVLIAQGDRVVHCKGYGEANREHAIRNTPDTVFRIASLSKQFTAVALMQLQEQGLLVIALLACNTLHAYLGRPPIPFFSLPEATLQEALGQGRKRLLILGTEETRKNQLYGAACYPDQEGQLLVNRVIDHILEGEICEEDATLLTRYIATFSVDGVVLGCTDLPVLHHHFPIACEVPIFDSIKIPAKNILRGLL